MTISKAWEFNAEQQITILDKTYNVHACISMSSELEAFDLDIKSMNLSYARPNNEDSLKSFVAHMKSVMDADLGYPILLNEDGAIIDGRHRLCKALYLGLDTIKAKRFKSDDDASYFWV